MPLYTIHSCMRFFVGPADAVIEPAIALLWPAAFSAASLLLVLLTEPVTGLTAVVMWPVQGWLDWWLDCWCGRTANCPPAPPLNSCWEKRLSSRTDPGFQANCPGVSSLLFIMGFIKLPKNSAPLKSWHSFIMEHVRLLHLRSRTLRLRREGLDQPTNLQDNSCGH